MTSDTPDQKPIEVSPDLPDPALPDADWADAFEITTQRTDDSLFEIAQRALGNLPTWTTKLIRLRNLIVVPFGLKSGADGDLTKSGGTIGIFPVRSKATDRVVLGLDDKHLDFRIVFTRERNRSHHRIRLTTLVQRHNRFGRFYIGVIAPFHRAIVAATLRPLGKANGG